MHLLNAQFFYFYIMDTDLILKNVARHVSLDDTEIDFFLSLLTTKQIARKEYLLREGEICRAESFIVKGCLRTYAVAADGSEHILMFGIEDWWVGDLYSFLTQTPSAFFIDALEDTEVLQITRENLERLCQRVPKFERFFRLIIQNAFIATQKRINQNLAFTAEEKYLDFIAKYPHLEQRLTQKQVAAYLGITPVFLSMLRKKLAHK